MRIRFFFVTGFWYPGALGASIAWWLQAVTTRSVDSAATPSLWALAFGLWFIIYHTTWFTYLLSGFSSTPDKYERQHFASDLLDGAALLLAFASMGFPSAQYRLLDHGFLFSFAALIPISALVGNANRHKPSTYLMTLAALLVAGVGAVTGWGTVSDVHGCREVVLLLLLYVLLGIYLVLPRAFGSQRKPSEYPNMRWKPIGGTPADPRHRMRVTPTADNTVPSLNPSSVTSNRDHPAIGTRSLPLGYR